MTQLVDANLGDEITQGGTLWRVIRITKQDYLFEDSDGKQEVVSEHLLELKSVDGSIDFEVLSSTRASYEGAPSSIKAPDPIVWRKD